MSTEWAALTERDMFYATKKIGQITHLYIAPSDPVFNLSVFDCLCEEINKTILLFVHSPLQRKNGLIHLPWGIKTCERQRYCSYFFPSRRILDEAFAARRYLAPLTEMELARYEQLSRFKVVQNIDHTNNV